MVPYYNVSTPPILHVTQIEKCCRNGVKLADLLESLGKQVIGWDIDWRMNYKISRYVIGSGTLPSLILDLGL